MAIPIGQVGDFLEEQLEEVVQGVRMDTFQEAVDQTPVDKGDLRADWIVTDRENSKKLTAGRGNPSSRIRRDAVNVPIDRDIYLINNSPYADFINRREKIVEKAVKKGRKAVSKYAGR